VSGRRVATSETVADYDVRSPAVRTIVTVLGTVLTVAAVGALVLGLSIVLKDSRVATSQVDVGQNANLIINATSADLEIVEGEPDLLTIASTVTSGLRKTDYQVGRKGDEIKIVSNCQRWLNPGCGVKTRLEVPPGLPLRVRTTSGDIRVRAISKGVLTVRTASGDVMASGLKVDEFEATTTAGDVSATFAEQPFAFKATTGSGDVTAMVPAGKRTYIVTTKTGSGNVSSALDSDAKGEGFVRVTTRSGDIRLTTS